jgi:uncharacterized protein (TIGR03086 family)
MMDAKQLFGEAVKEASSCVLRVEPEWLKHATPCSEWDLRALVNHMVYEMAWVPDLLAGKTVAEVGGKYDGDLLGKNVLAAWRKVLANAVRAVEDVDPEATVHLSYGNFPAEYYIRESGADMLIHGWDVGQALQCSLIFERAASQAVFEFVKPRAAELRASGLFGKQIPALAGDSTQAKLLALFGRPEKVWQARVEHLYA